MSWPPASIACIEQFFLDIQAQIRTLEMLHGIGLFTLTDRQFYYNAATRKYMLTNLRPVQGNIFQHTIAVPVLLLTNKKFFTNAATAAENDKTFYAPELLQAQVLPAQIPASAAYYSLGLLCEHFLSLAGVTLHPESKLRCCLDRCLEPEPFHRALLWI